MNLATGKKTNGFKVILLCAFDYVLVIENNLMNLLFTKKKKNISHII